MLSVNNLDVIINTVFGEARAVRDLSFELDKGQTLGLVGESGCGKSITALAILGLLPENSWAKGQIQFNGRDLLSLNENEMCSIRGNKISMVFQEPMTSLNPLHTIGKQIAEPMILHGIVSRGSALKKVIKLLDMVGISEPSKRISSYPHELSGGQRQRVMIAMALSCNPEILIADEPTTALDVTIQKQILDLIYNLINDLGMSMILISHDLGVIANNVNEIIVMYGGSCVEKGPTRTLFSNLSHPYSQGLFSAIPTLKNSSKGKKRLKTIPGFVPELTDIPSGCTFNGRCSYVTEECKIAPPSVVEVAPNHYSACLHIDEVKHNWVNNE